MGERDTWEVIIRFFHVISGITWIGLLYYFNLVQGWAFPKMDAAARTNATQFLVPRALLFFRYAALSTVVFGILWIIVHSGGFDDPGKQYFDTARFKSVAVGGTLGILMFLNVWGIIWPNQKKIIAAAQTGGTADPAWGRRATLASRSNVAMSIPMLFFMIAAPFLARLWN